MSMGFPAPSISIIFAFVYASEKLRALPLPFYRDVWSEMYGFYLD
jgi:hypothetical protein